MKKKVDIIETAFNAGTFQVFTKALSESAMKDTLKETGPFTIFAPTDQAFAKLSRAQIDSLVKNQDALHLMLRNHIVLGKLTSNKLKRLDKAKSAKGEDLRIDARNGIWINDAKVLAADLEASNGVLHAIDSVLLPRAKAAAKR